MKGFIVFPKIFLNILLFIDSHFQGNHKPVLPSLHNGETAAVIHISRKTICLEEDTLCRRMYHGDPSKLKTIHFYYNEL